MENGISGGRHLEQRAASWAALRQGEALRRRGRGVVVCFLRIIALLKKLGSENDELSYVNL